MSGGEINLKVTGNRVTGAVMLVVVVDGEDVLHLPLAPADALGIAEGLRAAVSACRPEPVAVATHAGSAARN